MLARTLESHGHAVVEARDEPEAIEQLRASAPGRSSCPTCACRAATASASSARRRSSTPRLPVIVMTAYGSIQDAVAAMKQGALDFLAKPVDPDHLLLLVDRAVAQRRLVAEYLFLKEELASRRGLPKIVGSRAGAQAGVAGGAAGRRQRRHGAARRGERHGQGAVRAGACTRSARAARGRLSRSTARRFPRGCSRPSCSATRRGAFTGAAGRKLGKFEVADGGTIFLDEIGDLPLPLQAKILRVLETRSFERVGGTATIRVDVRVVAATNRNLRAAVAARQFREDLYFRLSVFPITIPPLRERQEDILLLARHFVERFCREMNKPVMAIDRRGATRRCGRTGGRATCGSCRTASSAP